MKRRLFTILAAGSLLVCMITLAMWIRSFHHDDHVAFVYSHGVVAVDSVDTVVAVSHGWTTRIAKQIGFRASSVRFSFYVSQWENRGFGHQVDGFASIGVDSAVIDRWRAPYWFICTCMAAMPLCFAIRGRIVARRSSLRFCSNCGYDLRATPDRCPECGSAPAMSIV
jgi:hypothetical protein